ncbi:MAG: phosphoenolpyruvate--protein phosphotransferase [Lachnospiraceae bacterium]|nr:phosphoenolpyruvate--protein phosphotransferase [Lachnospiraceae bacterium]
MKYKGLPINDGIVIGRIRERFASGSGEAKREKADADFERMRFFDALLEFESSMKKVASESSSKEGSDIISAQIMISRDPVLSDDVLELIDSGMFADEALEEACKKYSDMLNASGDETVAARNEDLEEVKNGIMSLMGGEVTGAQENVAESDGDVIFADRLSAAQIVSCKAENVKAVVMRGGSGASHAAVILRSMGIVAVFGVPYTSEDVSDNKECIVDGRNGIVIIDPTSEEKAMYSGKAVPVIKKPKETKGIVSEPVKTKDGTQIGVLCNISSGDVPEEAAYSDGAGLVRTEFLFMSGGLNYPENEQEEIYARIADSFAGKDVVIRTMDVGGDKGPDALLESESHTDNPALGLRGIRRSLLDPDSFMIQARAILKASKGRKIDIMIPMVTSLSEVIEARHLIEGCRYELGKHGLSYREDIKLGCMMETPAAVMCARELAREVDFFSIGTNDLSQYIMCADRGNPAMAGYVSIYQPAVIRAVKQICDAAISVGIPVTVCGEAASDTCMLPVFLGLGVKNLSVSPYKVEEIKRAVRGLTMSSCRSLTSLVLEADTVEKIKEILK